MNAVLACFSAGVAGGVALSIWTFFPDSADRIWVATANAVTFGWYRRLEQRSAHPVPAFCTHWQAVAVYESATGDIVAWLCPGCDRQLAERPPLALPPCEPDPRLTAHLAE